MTRYFVTLILSVLGAPAVALIIAHGIHDEAFDLLQPLNQHGDACLAPATLLLSHACALEIQSQALQNIAAAAIGASVVLPIVYLGFVSVLGRRRESLARLFPPVVKFTVVALVAFMVLQGLLLLSSVLLLANAGHATHAALFLVVLGAGQLFAALLLISSWQHLLETEPLAVTGVIVDESRLPALIERIASLAEKLGATRPSRLIIGLEPTAFVTSATINLCGRGALPPAETLYLPALALRALSDSELDAIIGHELGHFRGEDLRYTERFIPAFAALLAGLESLNIEDHGESQWLRLARLPGLSLLSGMLYTFQRAVHRISHTRELAADQAAVEVADPWSFISALVKMIVFGVQWSAFQQGNSVLVNTGRARRNLIEDYLTRTEHLIAAMEPFNLHNYILGTRLAHPLDIHPTFAERASALGVDAETAIDCCLPELSRAVANDVFHELGEEVSLAEAEDARSPGLRLSMDKRDELPLSLDLPPIAHRKS